MFSTPSCRDIQWGRIFSYGLLAVLTIFFAVFFGFTSTVLPYFIAPALILIILTASTLIDIQENSGENVG